MDPMPQWKREKTFFSKIRDKVNGVAVAAFVLILIWVFALSISDRRILGPEDNGADLAAKFGSKYDAADLALMETCNTTQWVDGLWLNCHSECGPNKKSICGGLNNARNRLQICMRLAIDIGAGVMFPYVTQRPEANWASTDTDAICPDVWWDIEMLKEKMAERCPRFQISSCQEQPEGITRDIEVLPRHYKEKPHFNQTWRMAVNQTLEDNQISLADVTPENPLLLRYHDSHIAWSYRLSGEMKTLRKSLFRTLPFNRTILAVGEELFKSEGLNGGNYIGIHLRAEYDWPTYWGTPERQMEMHAAEVRKTNAEAEEPVTTVYVSGGDPAVIQKFRDVMGPEYNVTDKWMLFADRPDMLELIEHLPFDQKAIVEYPVLVKGRYFQGNLISTMSSVVVYARTMDQPEEFFDTYIYPDTIRWGLDRFYNEPLVIKGDKHTKEFVMNGQDIMDSFP
ncbi:hypothetical protein CPLU01_13688 [Colletotrichum plurivorum]|uniref:Alternative oxidase n=1 Tax=Colletotrichum plurivorum TaxID=2175906 RepID=A0A8H6N1N6_9PEZI|nr:hypothetical protein CPLU01_13688 [Colletotrichum plurivorum]